MKNQKSSSKQILLTAVFSLVASFLILLALFIFGYYFKFGGSNLYYDFGTKPSEFFYPYAEYYYALFNILTIGIYIALRKKLTFKNAFKLLAMLYVIVIIILIFIYMDYKLTGFF